MKIELLLDILKINKNELEVALKEYGSEDANNPTIEEKIYTSLDIYFERVLDTLLCDKIITDAQRDEIIDRLMNSLK